MTPKAITKDIEIKTWFQQWDSAQGRKLIFQMFSFPTS